MKDNIESSKRILETLTPEERSLALSILGEISETGSSKTLDDIKYADYDEIPVDIATFLHDKKYLGNGLTDPDGRFTLFPYWEEKLKEIFPDNVTTKYNTIIFTGAIGLGKAQPLDSEVLTRTGFKKMKDLRLGELVFGNDGRLHPIIGIFPQGTRPICKVTFTDDTSTLCCDEHLWRVYNTKNKKWTTIETKQLMDGSRSLKHSKGHRYKIPITSPIEFEKQDLVIPPYTLGVLLGDGHIIKSIRFSSADSEIPENIAKELPADYEVRKNKAYLSYSICKVQNNASYDKTKKIPIPTPNKYFEYIKQNKLNVKAEHKFIPHEYLLNSVENRISLLQGLMDTDGYVSKDGSLIEYTTVSEQLKNDFVWLVQSLGGTCHIRIKFPTYNNKNGEKVQGLKCYNIGIKLPKSICPFKLKRKENRLSQKSLEPFRYIKKIEYVKPAECQCIVLDSKEHLYLTNDFIVTHNSTIAVICLLYLLYRLLCLKDPYLYYGLQPIDKITISLMNITIENAKGVALDKMNQMIMSSDWFMSHGKMTGISNLCYQPDKRIELITASSNNQVIGRAVYCLSGSTEIYTSDGAKKIETLVDKPIQVWNVNNEGKKELGPICTVKPTLKTNVNYQVELADGSVINCTADHLFKLDTGAYKKARDLTIDDVLAELKLSYFEFIDNIIQARGMKIKSIQKIILPEAKQYYDVIDSGPFHNFLIKTNSGYVISHNCNFSDEVNWGLTTNTEKLKQKYKTLIAQIDARMKSRFLRGTYLPTLNIIASSKNSEQSFLEDYIQTKKKNESRTTLIVDEPQWIVDSRKDTKEKFHVAIGNKYLPNEMLPHPCPKELLEEYRAKGYSIIEVPMGYIDDFRDNIDQALMDIAGIATAASIKYISGARWNEIKTDSYENPFVKEIISTGTGKDDETQYSQYFDLSRVPSELRSKPMFVHLDMSKSGDKTGIAGIYVMGKKPSVEGQDASKDLFFRVAFSVSVEAPKGREISFDKNRTFIRWLREQGFNVVGVSSDTFQSAQLQQQLSADGFDVKIVSVDRVDTESRQCLPYAYLQSVIYGRRLEVYKNCDFLTEEVLGLERESDGHINHPEQGTQGSKDSIDAVTGALWNASRNAEKLAYDYGESLDMLLEANGISVGGGTPEQMMVDFEAELRKSPTFGIQTNPNQNQQRRQDDSPVAYDGMLIW